MINDFSLVQCGHHEALKQLIPSCSVYNKHWSDVMLIVDSVLYSGTRWLVSVPKPTGLNIQALASLKLVPQLLRKVRERQVDLMLLDWSLGKLGSAKSSLCCIVYFRLFVQAWSLLPPFHLQLPVPAPCCAALPTVLVRLFTCLLGK